MLIKMPIFIRAAETFRRQKLDAAAIAAGMFTSSLCNEMDHHSFTRRRAHLVLRRLGALANQSLAQMLAYLITANGSDIASLD